MLAIKGKLSMCTKDIKLSKLLSWILRHGATKEGLTFEEGGFIDVEKILRLKQFNNYCEADIVRVVETNDKKRFALRYKKFNNILQVRANQGHSIDIAEDGLLILLPNDKIPPLIYHGTYFQKLERIMKVGLSKMNRNHIHFTKKFPGESDVISGMRKNCEVFVVVNGTKAHSDGFKFYKSENGVILCPGDENGLLPSTYIHEVWQMSPLKKLQ